MRRTLAHSPSRRSAPSNSVPLPMISRSDPSTTSTEVIPNPIQNPSNAAGSTSFFEANASARPMIMQLVTISGIKMPSER
ncbi:Uncharacterised protein [Vibrio cholerae]|nr:Uncharacterised protein [Vibrio cholerae]